MLTAGAVARLPGWPLLAGGSAVVALGAAQGWPLLTDADASSRLLGADRALHLVLATAVALSCLAAASRHEGRDRTALLLLTTGAQAYAVLQAVHLGQDLLRRPADLSAWDALATVVLSAAVTAALWLLRPPLPPERARCQAAEWALVALACLVLIRSGSASAVALGGASVLVSSVAVSVLAAAVLMTCARPGATTRPWPWVPAGLAVLIGGLVLQSLSLDRTPPVAGLLVGAGLAVVAVAVLRGGAAAEAGQAVPGLRAAGLVLVLLPTAAVVVALLGLLEAGRAQAWALLGLVGLGLLAALHGHLRTVEARADARELSETEADLRHRAFHDDLTGLANRALFLDRLAHALDLHRRHRLPLSVLYCDLDGFKQVNDRYGHSAGDDLLVAVADRLRDGLRPEDTLARLGGDEFVLLLEHSSSPQVVADRVRELLAEPFPVAGDLVPMRVSVGTARVGADAATPQAQELLERADADMYGAKRRRAAPARSAAASAGAAGDLRAGAVSPEALALALDSGAVQVVYQPVVDVRSGAVHGMEALVRWTHDGRVLLPQEFLGMAERSGLSGRLTEVVLEQACAQLRSWSTAAGHARLTMAVNVGASQLRDPGLAAQVRAAVERHQLGHQQLVLEAGVEAVVEAGPTRDDLRLSLCGLSGDPRELELLSAPSVCSVKLLSARSTSDDACGDRLLHVLVALGREIDVRVIVERVEHSDELAALREVGGVLAQGYVVSRPAPAAEWDRFVLQGAVLPTAVLRPPFQGRGAAQPVAAS